MWFSPIYTSVDAQTTGLSADSVRGVVRAQQESLLTVSLRARVIEAPVRIGDAFQKGDTLLRFDCDVQSAEASAAYADYKSAKAKYDNTVEMQNFDAAGAFDVKISKAEMEKAAARSRAMKARTKDCDLLAPYNGKVADVMVNVHETPLAETPVMKIVGGGALELKLIVPSEWLAWLVPGHQFTFHVDETDSAYKASVQSIGAEVDATSHTAPIIAVFEEAPLRVLPGMSGYASFTPPSG